MRWLRTVTIMVIITILMFLGLEGIARVFLWHPIQTDPPKVSFGFSTGGYGDLIPNLDSLELVYPMRPYRLVTNSVGLRNTDELDDNPDVTRILAIGDSFTFGYYVHNEETYPARLEEVLEQSLGKPIQVLNAGIPGYTLADELAYLKEKGLQLNPDAVVLGFYTNDIFDNAPQLRQYFAREAMMQTAQGAPAPTVSPVGQWLRDNSALFNGLLALRGQLSDAQIQAQVNRVTPTIPGLQELYHNVTFLDTENPEYLPYWQAYERDFRELVSILAERQIPLVLVAFPDLNQYPTDGMPLRPQAFLANLTRELDVLYLDMLPIFRELGDIQSLYLMYYALGKTVDPNAPDHAVQAYTGDGHLSMFGHLVTARELASLLIDHGFVK